MKKKILSVMLSAAMCAGLLAGCGGQGGSGETQGSAAGAGSQGQTADGGDAGEDVSGQAAGGRTGGRE